MSWAISGTYLEACNCDAVCPCRRVGSTPGGRSSYGECKGALSWKIDAGHADGTDLSGAKVVLALRYHDDEPGSPWTYALFIDTGGDDHRSALLADIFTGRLGSVSGGSFPWADALSTLVSVDTGAIEVDHTPGRGWFRARGQVEVRIREPFPTEEPVTCGIPGHDRAGRELISETIELHAGPLVLSVAGRCAYETTFSHRSIDL